MRKGKHQVPKPPRVSSRMGYIIQEGIEAGMIWLLREDARGAIETLYANASSVQTSTGCSRATAYRIIGRHPKRYWLIDYTDQGSPSCCMVIPTDAIKDIELSGRGNPNFKDGIYQQAIALRRSKGHGMY